MVAVEVAGEGGGAGGGAAAGTTTLGGNVRDFFISHIWHNGPYIAVQSGIRCLRIYHYIPLLCCYVPGI